MLPSNWRNPNWKLKHSTTPAKMFTKLKTMNDVGLFPVDCPKLLSLTALISIFTNFDSGGGTFGWPTDVQLDNSLLCWRSANKVNATLATHRAQPSLPNTRKYILYSRWRCAWKCPAPLFPRAFASALRRNRDRNWTRMRCLFLQRERFLWFFFFNGDALRLN